MQYLNPYIELCLEGSFSVFKGLPQKEKEIIALNHSYVIYRKKDFLFKYGEKSQGIICLASGKAKVFREGVGGREQIIKMVQPQGIICYNTLFTEVVYSFSAVAIEETAICVFDKNVILKTLKRHPDLSLKFLKVVTEELAYSNNRIISLTQKHVRARLAESLLLLRDTYGFEVDGMTLRIILSREDLAGLSNMTTSNAIRTLSTMVSEGLVETEGRKILILDSNTLERISEEG